MMKEPRVAIVVLNRNGGRDLLECLESIFRNDYDAFEVILVDSSSDDGSVELVKSWAEGREPVESPFLAGESVPKPVAWHQVGLAVAGEPEAPASRADRVGPGTSRGLTILASEVNLGFAGGHNVGIEAALARDVAFVMLLNSDIVVDRHFLAALVAEAGTAAAVGPAVLYYKDSTRVWQAGGEISASRGWAQRAFADRRLEETGTGPFETAYLPGCAVLLRREALEAVGRLDPDYFLYFEDTDWFARAARLGFRFMLVPRSRVWHKETRLTMMAKSVHASYYFSRNRLMFVKKNHPARLASAVIWTLRYGIGNNLVRRRWRHLGMSLRGTWDFFRGVKGQCRAVAGAYSALPNILVFSTDYKPQPGGIAEHAYKVAIHLQRQGARVTVLAPKYGEFARFDRAAPVDTIRVNRIPGIDLVLYFLYALYVIARRNIGLVYCATSNPCAVICKVLNLFTHFRFAVTIHGHEVVYSRATFRQKVKIALRPIQVAWINGADRVFAVSNFTRTALIDAGVEAGRISVMFNGIDIDDFKHIEGADRIIGHFGLEGKRVILTVARLDIHKGHDVVIKALPAILEKVPDAVYVIAGDGPTRTRLEALAEAAGVVERVVFAGLLPRNDVLALFQTCDVFVMISRIEGSSTEGFGIVFLEAGAFSKPVVGGRAGGIPDAVKDGVTGLLVDPNSPAEVAHCVSRILLDCPLAATLGGNGLERVRSQFTWDRIVDLVIDGLDAMAP